VVSFVLRRKPFSTLPFFVKLQQSAIFVGYPGRKCALYIATGL